MTVSRRGFVSGSLALATAAPFAGCGNGAARTFREAARDIPVGGEYDLVVAGGGPAGIAAAIAAARAGRRVKLFESHGALGGIWTSGLLSCIIDFGRADLSKEIIARLDRLGARMPRRRELVDSNFLYEPECMKLVLEQLATEAGVSFTYHSPVVAAYRDASGRNVEAVATESKSGRRAWKAKFFMDCTGDGDLAALAGCGFDTGGVNKGDAEQPASLIALLVVDDDSAITRFTVDGPKMYAADGAQIYNPKKELYEEFRRVGVEPSYASPTLFRIRRNMFAFMGNHEYGVKLDNADAVTAATVRARQEIFALVDALVRMGGSKWKGLRVVATAEQLGHRTARRIHGRYSITVDDLLEGRRFDDAVADCAFGIDVHGVSRAKNRTLPAGSPGGLVAKPYQIPLRACWAKDLDNLYMAGRCISGDFLSQASYRVTGPAVEMGERVARRLFGMV